MPTTAEYLADIVERKNELADRLNSNGVKATRSERLDTLVPKVEELVDVAQADFADFIQDYGLRKYYSAMFYGFTDLELLKKFRYNFYCLGATSMFAQTGADTELYPDGFDLVEMLKTAGISITWPTNGINEASGMFNTSRVSHVPPIKLSGVNSVSNLFKDCSCLKTVDSLEFPIYSSATGNWFAGCTALENITFAGSWKSVINLSVSPLTVNSMLSLFSAMYDYSTSTSSRTATLGTANLAKLTDEQKAIATNKNWTLV